MNKSVDRAIDILMLVGKSKTALSVTEIARELDMPKTTAFNIIQTLVKRDMLAVSDARFKLYELGALNYEFGNLYINQIALIDVARPVMKRISERLSAIVFLTTIYKNELLYLDKIDLLDDLFRSTMHIGFRSQMHSTSMGKALLSSFDDESLNEYLNSVTLEKVTKYTVTDKDVLKEHIQTIRRQGYAISNEENELGLYCLGHNIYDASGRAVAALGISFVKVKCKEQMYEQGKIVLIEECRAISQKLGYRAQAIAK